MREDLVLIWSIQSESMKSFEVINTYNAVAESSQPVQISSNHLAFQFYGFLESI